ncbi:prolyl 3-hydroxylase 1 isoform X1 [Cynara cardunculus var. scolymus]|uniref:procollagen-proline 3-dioxygenase n=1 Tax=Cynara cardunculus var. scolymus TaxID=59895 RepID=A0A118JXS7_CYNCS|nr:prolyl 3-hydroxylase 1 isoform X1 [Cynara cardunculus var. scolymus]KVH97464.1 Oxoglutarate/iron-dependent dioxygenase [Cynara cardunculus var. scolymus]
MAESEHPRLILHKFLSPDLCKELEFIHKSCSTIGYRKNVFSTTLSHLIATNSPHLILPFIPIREKLKEKVEEFFGCEYELFIEFTGLISWSKGASISWHSDDNRPYLKQRDYAAVCYLNSYGVDFGGGLFHFQDGEPTTFIPMAGDVLIYTADSRNVHSVEEITKGERLTLTLWFTRDKSHDEDVKLISFLTKCPFNCSDPSPSDYLPLPASQNMYWFPPEQSSTYQSGFDIRFARLHVLGYKPYSSDASSLTKKHSSSDFSDILLEPLSVVRGNELFDKEFANLSHLLQMVQFYHWKAPQLQRSSEFKMEPIKVVPISTSHRENICRLTVEFLKDEHLAETIFHCMSCGENDWVNFCGTVDLWEAYTSKLWHKMVVILPKWVANQSIFYEPNGWV